MSTPMNISKVSMGGTCDERCSYSYQYNISTTCVATNYGSFIMLSYENGNTTPVLFNNIKYSVGNIEIYSPSIHTFNNNLADAEIIIVHTSIDTGAMLLVCIPIMSGTNSNPIITEVLNGVVTKPLKQGEPAMSINIPSYNLNSIIPSKPFFYYISQTAKANVIVYSIGDAITVGSTILTNLKTLVTQAQNPLQPSANNYLFYNNGGPKLMNTNGNMDGQIYIDCSPTGNSEETMDVDYNKTNPTETFDFSPYLTDENKTMAMYVLGFVVALFLINKLLTNLTTSAK